MKWSVGLLCDSDHLLLSQKSLYKVTPKNRFWPFLKKTLSNNFADKSYSTPTLGQCEWYGCVNLFMLPWSIFGYCCSPPYTVFIKKNFKLKEKQLSCKCTVFCYCWCSAIVTLLSADFFVLFYIILYRARTTKTTKSDWPLVMEWEQRSGKSFLIASGTSRFESFTLQLREMWDLSTMLGKLERSEESTFFIG